MFIASASDQRLDRERRGRQNREGETERGRGRERERDRQRDRKEGVWVRERIFRPLIRPIEVTQNVDKLNLCTFSLPLSLLVQTTKPQTPIPPLLSVVFTSGSALNMFYCLQGLF